MDSKSGPRSEGGDWTGYFVSGQEAIGYGAGFLVLAARLNQGKPSPALIEQVAANLEEWGLRFLSADESQDQSTLRNIQRWIDKNINQKD